MLLLHTIVLESFANAVGLLSYGEFGNASREIVSEHTFVFRRVFHLVSMTVHIGFQGSPTYSFAPYDDDAFMEFFVPEVGAHEEVVSFTGRKRRHARCNAFTVLVNRFNAIAWSV